METPNKIMPVILKASVFATVLFWMIDILNGNYKNISPFIIFSIIPAFILCSFAICITIMPFIWSEKKDKNRDEIFEKYFPYYAIITFGFCSYFIVISNFDKSACSFLFTLFFTLMQSWVWICKKNVNERKEKNDSENNENNEI